MLWRNMVQTNEIWRYEENPEKIRENHFELSSIKTECNDIYEKFVNKFWAQKYQIILKPLFIKEQRPDRIYTAAGHVGAAVF